jgi:EAL domain-containing protein (putative c-di-GMP-specific phosphodiesterase class I)
MTSDIKTIFSNNDLDFVFHLEKAIDNGEFEVYYQPIIHTISGSLCGFEALVRWHHPTLGFMMPGQFLTALEDTNQIYHLDIHIIECVCKWYKEQIDSGRPVVPVSVNLSRIDFESTDMFQIIEDIRSKYGMPRNMLNIEITESAMSANADLMRENVARFRNAGYQVWMDDFGSGYSSLNTLKDFEFDEIKIDMVFLSEMNEKSRQIIRSMISMAKDISMVTLVEGVETKEQYDFLRSIGCDRMQGYYFSRPLPYDEIVKVLEDKGIPFETEEDRLYYHKINRINPLSASPFSFVDGNIRRTDKGIPLAMIEKKDDQYRFIYQDDDFKQLIETLGASNTMECIQKLVHFGVLSREEIDKFLDDVINLGEQTITFNINGDFCSAHAMLVSTKHDCHAILLSINNITERTNISHKNLMDQNLMNIYSMYLRVSLLRPELNEMLTLFSNDHHGFPADTVCNMYDFIHNYADIGVHKDDRDRYLEFLDPDTIEHRIRSSKRGFINTKIRTVDEDGNYSNKMYIAIAAGNHEISLLVRYANL